VARRVQRVRQGAGLPEFIKTYVRWVDRLNYAVGRFAMYLLFAMMAILLWSSISKAISGEPFRLLDAPAHWTLLMAQFAITAYYMLGGPYSLQLGSNVRMDLLYGSWSTKTKAWADAFTVLTLLFYLGVLLYGGFVSTEYAIQYGERSPGLWRSYLWPIKIVMCTGIVLMILQTLAIFFRDVATIRGVALEPGPADNEIRADTGEAPKSIADTKSVSDTKGGAG
jgi:TRAP-type mannitol/chloroaromatic compound transport system permease small subunit